MTSSREPGRHAAPDDSGSLSLPRRRGRGHTPRRAAPPPNPNARRGLRLAAQIVAATLSAAIVIGTGWAWRELRTFNDNVSVGTRVSQAPGAVEEEPTVRRDVNILLLGNDSRAGASPAELQALGTQDDGGSANTDTMLVLHIPADGSRATAISFPRDSYVDIPGYGKDKLNAAYPDGYNTAEAQGAGEIARQSAGIQVLISTLNKLTGLTINHYVQVNLLGFYRISQALGGVEVCLREPAQESNSGIDLPAGRQKIEGTQALAFVRQRYGFPDGRGDIDRITRQQYFLSSALRQILSAGTLLNPNKLSDLLDAVSKSLLIDPDLDLFQLASQLSSLQAGNVNFYTIPLAGEDDYSPVGSVLLVDPAQVAAFVKKTFYPPTATASPSPGTSASGGAPTTTAPPTTAPPTTAAPGGETSSTPTAVNAADPGCIY